MINYPISFYANAHSKSGMAAPWTVESQNIFQTCAIPPEFEGPGEALSPEDLFAQALTNCFVATFKVYAEKSKVQFTNLVVKTELIADLNENKKPVMKKCTLNVKIAGCENPERVKLLAEKAFTSGFIINSVKTELAMILRIVD
jgi:organic hydroperoxide reductase OsmC/OhrA